MSAKTRKKRGQKKSCVTFDSVVSKTLILTKEQKGGHCVDDVCADVNQVIFTLQTAKIIGISRIG